MWLECGPLIFIYTRLVLSFRHLFIVFCSPPSVLANIRRDCASLLNCRVLLWVEILTAQQFRALLSPLHCFVSPQASFFDFNFYAAAFLFVFLFFSFCYFFSASQSVFNLLRRLKWDLRRVGVHALIHAFLNAYFASNIHTYFRLLCSSLQQLCVSLVAFCCFQL